mgnify:FL=1
MIKRISVVTIKEPNGRSYQGYLDGEPTGWPAATKAGAQQRAQGMLCTMCRLELSFLNARR